MTGNKLDLAENLLLIYKKAFLTDLINIVNEQEKDAQFKLK